MLLTTQRKEDLEAIKNIGKAGGALLLRSLLPNICDITNIFVFDSIEDYESIEKILPDSFTLRADAELGKKPTLRVRGCEVKKDKDVVKQYLEQVKKSNPDGVVLCMTTKTVEKNIPPIQGSFNVYFEYGKKVFIDYLEAGFDVGGITKGEENHERYIIEWEDILFVKPNTMNRYNREYLITPEEYAESAERRIKFYMEDDKWKCSRDEARKKVPQTYKPMPLSIKQLLCDEIIFPIYVKADEIKRLGLESFGIQGMIRDGKLFPIEVNRRERFTAKQDLVEEKRQAKLEENPQPKAEQQKEGLRTLTVQVFLLPTDAHEEAQKALGHIISERESGIGCATNG